MDTNKMKQETSTDQSVNAIKTQTVKLVSLAGVAEECNDIEIAAPDHPAGICTGRTLGGNQ